MTSALSVVELLEHLVRFPSISGSESELVAWLAGYLSEQGFHPVVDGRNLYVHLSGRDSQRCLLLNTHLDVVPPGEGWTADPFVPRHHEGNLYGRGANDAKGCAAAMILALQDVSRALLPGDVLLALTCDEETGGEGLEKLLPRLRPVSAAIIGEPTFNRPSLGMRGLLSLRLISHGRGCHASRPQEGVNPIYALARDILQLEQLVPPAVDPLLGAGNLAVTVIEGGSQSARNRVPDVAEAIVDVRTTPVWNNEQALAQIQETVTHSEIVVRSARIKPKATAPNEAIAQAAQQASQGDCYAFRGASDFTYVDAPAVILGPGNTSSHQPDEHIPLEMLQRAVGIYAKTVRHYFALTEFGVSSFVQPA